MSEAPAALAIARGTVHAFTAFDVGGAIDLDAAERRLGDARGRTSVLQGRRTPSALDFEPRPLHAARSAEALAVGLFAVALSATPTLYDFGAVSIALRFEVDGPFEEIGALVEELSESPVLDAEASRIATELIRELGDAVRHPAVDRLTERYVVVEVAELAPPVAPDALSSTHAAAVARLLRGATDPSADEIADAIHRRISWAPDDVAFVDWSAALVVDRDAADLLTVLEFVNVELLEMRFLDRRLDAALEKAYALLARRNWGRSWWPGTVRNDLRDLGALQVENAALFEGVNNALKLVGDQFLARVYRLASERFHLAEWDATILRKLDTLDSLYGKTADLASAMRIEILEWIIILLIAFEVVWSFVGE
jgi:hypothetical protein